MNPPASSYSLHDLAELTGVNPRTMRRWRHAGAISATEFRGPATRYGARHVDEARAVKRLLGENLSLEAIRARLSSLSDDELARFVGRVEAETEPAARDGGAAAIEAPASTVEATSAPETKPTEPEALLDAERWEHVRLLPGLQLLVRSGSGALVQRIAREIQERYAVAES